MKSMLSSALFAGIAVGLLGALLQYILVQPDIVLAERYESGELVHFQGVMAHDHSTHSHGTTEVASNPAEGTDPSELQRQALTVLFSLFTWCGFALVLMGAIRLTEVLGHRIPSTQGLLWGLGGFLAFQMMPALGLAPELPGTPAADLDARQSWWVITVVSTGLGLWLLAYGRAVLQRLVGAGALVAPHVWGAPKAEAMGGIVPPELAAEFAAHALGVGLITWAVLGFLIVTLWRRQQTE